jgi:hypothetical protein
LLNILLLQAEAAEVVRLEAAVVVAVIALAHQLLRY